ncbi:hypothetical protein O6H91_06G103500 [Diphasiastrum complanatum]|uniref:Uncharacterized protein n=1 Tax=Diphasiastrum complanatum TaxID=34168 RepID=A0ACC2DHD0_DIPCM|nr:hypothetical protein O6H91_06G103500 [Diphasiastrum complanatum]
METPSSDTWLNTSLLCQASQPDHHPPAHPYSLYPSDLLPLHPPGHLGHHIAENEPGVCDAFCQPFHQTLGPDFHGSSQLQHHQELPCFADCQPFPQVIEQPGSRFTKGAETADPASARKVHKADREKLRRDRLNEQFTELANALDPDRPKNDKATILGDCAQVLTELRAEVKRLKVDHATLLDESRDLTQEKIELREEKTTLKNETEQLQCQLQQRVRLLLSWTGMDPSLMMGATTFPYPLSVPSAASAPPNSQQTSGQTQLQPPVVAPAPYIPLPAPHGAFAMHPGLPAYAMFGNRPGNANIPFFPYPPYPLAPVPVGSHSHVERPFAQYPSPLHPVPGYALPSQPQEGSRPLTSIQPPEQPTHRPCPSAAPPTSSTDERVHDQNNISQVCNRVQQAEGEDQETASLLPASSCRNDTLHQKSADGLMQLAQKIDLQLQNSVSATCDEQREIVQDASVSSPEVKKEKAKRAGGPLSISCSPVRDMFPAYLNQNTAPVSKVSEDIG